MGAEVAAGAQLGLQGGTRIIRHGLARGQRGQHQAGCQRRQAQIDQPAVAELAAPAADQAALHRHHDNAHENEDDGVARGVQPQAVEREERKKLLEAAEGDLLEEHQRQQQPHLGMAQRLEHGPQRDGRFLRPLSAPFGGESLGQPEPGQQDGEQREARRHKGRDVVIIAAGGQRKEGDDRPDHKAQPKRRPHQAQPLGAVLLGGAVGDGRLGSGEIGPRQAVQEARQEQQPQGVGKAQNQEADQRAHLADQQHRPPPVAV